MEHTHLFPAEVKEVYSADDMLVQVDLKVAGVHIQKRARLHGVDAPDAFKKTPESNEGRLRDEVRRLVKGSCRVSIVKEVKGDLIVTLFYEKKGEYVNLNAELMERGYIFTHPERKERVSNGR